MFAQGGDCTLHPRFVQHEEVGEALHLRVGCGDDSEQKMFGSASFVTCCRRHPPGNIQREASPRLKLDFVHIATLPMGDPLNPEPFGSELGFIRR